MAAHPLQSDSQIHAAGKGSMLIRYGYELTFQPTMMVCFLDAHRVLAVVVQPTSRSQHFGP
jgi:hypothetical protein